MTLLTSDAFYLIMPRLKKKKKAVLGLVVWREAYKTKATRPTRTRHTKLHKTRSYTCITYKTCHIYSYVDQLWFNSCLMKHFFKHNKEEWLPLPKYSKRSPVWCYLGTIIKLWVSYKQWYQIKNQHSHYLASVMS